MTVATVEVDDTSAANVRARLLALSEKTDKRVVVEVGYNAWYAIYVHEILWYYHPRGQAKYLETAIRQQTPAVRAQIKRDLQNKIGMRQTMLRAGTTIQKASQVLVPVDTGLLRHSAYTVEVRTQALDTEGGS